MARSEFVYGEIGNLVLSSYSLITQIHPETKPGIWKAVETTTGQIVCFKMFPNQFYFENATLEEQSNSNLECVNRVIDFGYDEQIKSYYAVFEWIEGKTVSESLTENALENSHLLLRVLASLRDLHLSGLRHGDFHISNIMVRIDSSIVFIDLCIEPELDMLDFDRIVQFNKFKTLLTRSELTAPFPTPITMDWLDGLIDHLKIRIQEGTEKSAYEAGVHSSSIPDFVGSKQTARSL